MREEVASRIITREHPPQIVERQTFDKADLKGETCLCLDIITLTHDAKNRKGFALGAVLAAEYTANHEGFLGMNDLFQF